MLMRKMLSGCWLLADLDGTLVPTPHNAKGEYLSLDKGPCFHALQRWLANGGNLCVITTADRRVFDQVFLPLQQFCTAATEGGLPGAPRLAAVVENTAAAAAAWQPQKAAVTTQQQQHGGDVPATTSPLSAAAAAATGNVLVSLYTGAVMYECSRSGIEDIPGYSSVAAGIRSPSAAAATPGIGAHPPAASSSSGSVDASTCLSAQQADQLCFIAASIFLDYASAVLRGDLEAVASQRWLSLRYQKLWASLLHHLDGKYTHYEKHNHPKGDGAEKHKEDTGAAAAAAAASSSSSSSAAAVPKLLPHEWKIAYLSKRRHLLAQVGIIRKEREYSASEINAAYTSAGAAHHPPHGKATAITTAARTPGVDGGHAQPTKKQSATRAATRFSHESPPTFDGLDDPHTASHPTTTTSSSGASAAAATAVAQVIIVGMPMALFGRFFAPHDAAFRCLGVTPIAQPNSVVFSRSGVSKSTAVQYLSNAGGGPAAAPSSSKLQSSPVGGSTGSSSCAFRHAVALDRCVALGDNPHAADRELTVFPALRFVSCEQVKQRTRRQQQQQQHASDRERRAAAAAAAAAGSSSVGDAGSSSSSSINSAITHHAAKPPTATATAASSAVGGALVWDDRAHSNVEYIGGEETGTSLFLSYLMDELRVPPSPVSAATAGSLSSHTAAPASSVAAADAAVSSSVPAAVVSAEDFQNAVTDASHRARQEIHAQTLLASSKM